MNRDFWRFLTKKKFFTSEDIAGLSGSTRGAAQVFCSRQVKNGTFIRLKKDFYLLEDNWARLDRQDFFLIANHLQVPSYISCTTALVYHQVTSQEPQGWFESAALRRSI